MRRCGSAGARSRTDASNGKQPKMYQETLPVRRQSLASRPQTARTVGTALTETVTAEDPRWLRYLDPELESEFRSDFATQFAGTTRKTLRNIIALLVVVMGLDLLSITGVPLGHLRVFAAYGIFLVPALVAYVLPRDRFVAHTQAIMSLLFVLLCAVGPLTIWAFAVNELNFVALLGIALTLMLLFLFRLLLVYAAGALAAGLAVFIAAASAITRDFRTFDAAFYVVLLVCSGLVTLSVLRDLEQYVRREFVTKRLLRLQNSRLKTRIIAIRDATQQKKRRALDLESPLEKVISLLEGLKDSELVPAEAVSALDGALDILVHAENLTAPAVQAQLQATGEGAGGVDSQTSAWLVGEILRKRPRGAALPPLPNAPALTRGLAGTAAVAALGDQSSVEVPAKFYTLDFDTLAFAKTVSRPLGAVAAIACDECKVHFEHVGIDIGRLMTFVAEIETGYLESNPYHNATHAADVLQASLALAKLATPWLFDADMSGSLELAALLVAAIVHDHAHPGTSNNFLIETQSPLALLYNDRSVLENHHLSTAWKAVLAPQNNFIEGMSKEDRATFRELVIDLVLATDIARHFDLTGRFSSRMASGRLDESSKPDRLLLLQLLIKLADISNPVRPFAVYQRWATRVQDEFFGQGDRERQLDMKISTFMDRQAPAFEQSQVGFIDFLVMPFVDLWVKQADELQPLKTNIEANRQVWQLKLDELDVNDKAMPGRAAVKTGSTSTLTMEEAV